MPESLDLVTIANERIIDAYDVIPLNIDNFNNFIPILDDSIIVEDNVESNDQREDVLAMQI